LRSLLGAGLIACVALLLAPELRAPARASLDELLDPSLRVPFAAVLLRAPDAKLVPGERLLGLRRPGDGGLVAPRNRTALARALGEAGAGARVELDVHGPLGPRRVALDVAARAPARALSEQWPACLASAALLLFALACILGGRHPVATPLFAVSLALGAAIGSASDLALAGDGGLLGLAQARARLGCLAWCALPAALLHLAARFPVVVPSFRRPAIAALPYAFWAIPALLAQVRFAEPATVDAVERVALAASFLAGGVLVAACAFPGRPLSPVERSRARAAMVAFAAAGSGPLAAFVRGGQPAPAISALLALGALALPLALGWSVARYRLLDPPLWLRRSIVSVATALVALVLAAAATGAIWENAGSEPGVGAALALGTALAYQGFRTAAARLLAPRLGATDAAERLLGRASHELAAASEPREVLARLSDLLASELRPGALTAFFPADGDPPSLLARRGLILWQAAGAPPRRLVRPPRCEDPDPARPEAVIALEPRAGRSALLVLAARSDGLPYAPEELRALGAAARLATLALGDATASACLEARVASRTAALTRALDDRGAVVETAARIQAAPDTGAVREAALAFLERCTGGRIVRAKCGADGGAVAIELDVGPARSERFAVSGLSDERAVDLQPQVDAVAALANLALERLHLLAHLKLEVARQARELAQVAAGGRGDSFAAELAHELRKPTEEIRQLARAAGSDAERRTALARIEVVTHELSRRLDTLLSRSRPLDLRRVDLVRLADDAVARAARLWRDRRFSARHPRERLPLAGDPVRLASLLENLLDNAAKATAAGGRVELRTALVRGGLAVIEVEDDGAGVPPDLGADIFEPGVGCFQEGFGLGLALCRDVANAHGGRIAVASRPGCTIFRVELPQLGPDTSP
jgi:signal transduction histidine kinase